MCYEAEIPECAASLAEQGAEIILCPSLTFTEEGFWRVRHCAQARAIENQVYVVHCGGSATLPPDGPLPSPWGRSSILSPCDTPWDAPNGVVAESPAPNIETVVRGVVDLDRLHENRENGAAPTFRGPPPPREPLRGVARSLRRLSAGTSGSPVLVFAVADSS